ncbi:uncharacterized protein LOC135926826 [Gordionus sp. m RMFG-2023]|uniref:uncharacterized protein LOC135926826 n=1 Tax=Gordionus sp. m RMFG-2023 TaxID=3053472 RepID=UPI0031FCACC3
MMWKYQQIRYQGYSQDLGTAIKKISLRSVRENNESNIEIRKEYANWFVDVAYMKEKFIFIDESGFSISMRRLYRYSQINKKAIKNVQGIKTINYTIIAALTIAGIFRFEVLDGPCNAIYFSLFINEILNHFEESNMINMIFVMDNVPFHHNHSIRESIERKGRTLKYLPPYSPYFNPIENVFFQWKDFVRNKNPSNEEELIRYIEHGE